jgi:hypothetical protein
MAYQKLQTSRALEVIPSNNANIPSTNISASGANTSIVALQLVDSTAFFVTRNVQVGDVVYNTTSSTAATVTKVISETVIQLNVNIFTASPQNYIVYAANGTKEGCVLYVGTGGDLDVVTAGGQSVTFVGIVGGSFLPVQVLKVTASTTAADIVALW